MPLPTFTARAVPQRVLLTVMGLLLLKRWCAVSSKSWAEGILCLPWPAQLFLSLHPALSASLSAKPSTKGLMSSSRTKAGHGTWHILKEKETAKQVKKKKTSCCGQIWFCNFWVMETDIWQICWDIMFISKKQNVNHHLALKERNILWRRYFIYLVITPRSHSPMCQVRNEDVFYVKHRCRLSAGWPTFFPPFPLDLLQNHAPLFMLLAVYPCLIWSFFPGSRNCHGYSPSRSTH